MTDIRNLKPETLGIVAIILGSIILLNTLGVLRPLFFWALIIIALAFITYGVIKLNLIKKVRKFLKKHDLDK